MQFFIFFLILIFNFGCSFYTSSIPENLYRSVKSSNRKDRLGLTLILSHLGKMQNVTFKNKTQEKLISSREKWEKKINNYNFEYLDVLGDNPGLDLMTTYEEMEKRNLIEIEVTANYIENFSSLFFFFTLGLIPEIKSQNYTFDSKIYDRHGLKHSLELNKMYEFSEYKGWILFPLWLITDAGRHDEILNDMMLNYLEELDQKLNSTKISLANYEGSREIQKDTILANINHFECDSQIYLFRSPRYNRKLIAPNIFKSICSLDLVILNNSNEKVDLDFSKAYLKVGEKKITSIQKAIIQDDNQVEGVWYSAKQESDLNNQIIISLNAKEKKSHRMFFSILKNEKPTEWELIDNRFKLRFRLEK